jgi:hypothetical protein
MNTKIGKASHSPEAGATPRHAYRNHLFAWKRRLLAAIVAAPLVLAACGGDGGGSPPPNNNPPPVTPPPPPPPKPPVPVLGPEFEPEDQPS